MSMSGSRQHLSAEVDRQSPPWLSEAGLLGERLPGSTRFLSDKYTTRLGFPPECRSRSLSRCLSCLSGSLPRSHSLSRCLSRSCTQQVPRSPQAQTQSPGNRSRMLPADAPSMGIGTELQPQTGGPRVSKSLGRRVRRQSRLASMVQWSGCHLSQTPFDESISGPVSGCGAHLAAGVVPALRGAAAPAPRLLRGAAGSVLLLPPPPGLRIPLDGLVPLPLPVPVAIPAQLPLRPPVLAAAPVPQSVGCQ